MSAQSGDTAETNPANQRQHLEGWIPELAQPEDIQQALEKAFDFRGDISITQRDGSVVNGYVFDRRTGQTLADSFVRIMPAGSAEKRSIVYSDIARIVFDRRDPPRGRVGKPGYANIGRRRRPAKATFK